LGQEEAGRGCLAESSGIGKEENFIGRGDWADGTKTERKKEGERLDRAMYGKVAC
jgi:hypothetical protein